MRSIANKSRGGFFEPEKIHTDLQTIDRRKVYSYCVDLKNGSTIKVALKDDKIYVRTEQRGGRICVHTFDNMYVFSLKRIWKSIFNKKQKS